MSSRADGHPVEFHAFADRRVIHQFGQIIGEDARCFGRGETTYDSWHYVPVFAHKLGTLRDDAHLKAWPCRLASSGSGGSSGTPMMATGNW